MSRWFALPAWLLAAVCATAFWWWQGQPFVLPDAPSTTIPCVSYTPYRAGQSAEDATLVVPMEQIEDDLRLLSNVTGCIRTYGVGQGLDRIPDIAKRYGMTVMLGVWLGANAEDNVRELELGIDVANRVPETISALVVGNEVLLRGDLPVSKLIEHLRRARESVSVPVTYADVTDYWFRYRGLADSVDFVTIHILPYWDDDPVGVEQTMVRASALWRQAKEIFPDKLIVVGEAGWPSAGRMRGEALPSRVNQARFIRELLILARSENMDINLIEAFDQQWKRSKEGTVGGYWGLFSERREGTSLLTGPVSNDPAWRVHLAWTLAITLVPLVVVFALRRHLRPLGWTALAFASHAAACALVVAMVNVSQMSISVFDWAVGVLRWGLAAAAFILTVVAVVRPPGETANHNAVLPLREVIAALRSRSFRVFRGLAPALGLVRALTLFGAAVVTLGLVFDARYRDFPVAVYAVPALAFAVLAVYQRHQRPADFREEVLLAAILAVGGVAIAVMEGMTNHHAVAWVAVNVVLASTVAYQVVSRRHARRFY